MSREILFKGKRIFDGEWIEGTVLNIKGEENPRIATSCLIGEQGEPLIVAAYEIDPETLCQYTGLTDKNDKRIWENDIVQHVQRRAQRGVNLRVSWHTFKASWVLSKKGWMYNHFFEEGVEPEDVEVIGNFFDNPELLEDSDLTD